ncbi:hypothetical protein V8C43DRAFT_67454 [Trichoderma afarasin]
MPESAVHDKQLHLADVTPSVSNFQSSSFISQEIHFPRVAEVSSKATTLNLENKRKKRRVACGSFPLYSLSLWQGLGQALCGL